MMPLRLAWCSGRQHTRGAMLMNLDPGQSGWAVQLHPDCHVLGARLVEQLRTPHAPAQSPAARAKGRGARRDEEGAGGGWGPTTGTEGATGPTTLAGAASPEIKPPRPAVEPVALQAVGT